MSEFERTQWHPSFYAAMRLELRENREDLDFEAEKVLNVKPIQLDMLVIRRLQEIVVRNEIGAIFNKYNIFEYKSPEDELGISEYYKTLAYACLYKADWSKKEPKENDITISLVREGKPKNLIQWFYDTGCQVKEIYRGIYYVIGEKIVFPTQIIVTSLFDDDSHQWLRSLTSKMDKETGENLIVSATGLTNREDRENADAVLQLAMRENPALFQQLKGVPEMCEALKELMRPEWDAAKAEAKAEGKDEAREEIARDLLKDGTLSIEKISSISRLSVSRIRQLK